nr:MAG: ORF1 [Torque teno midi virus]
MPFWWKRRRKPWYGRWRNRRRFQRSKRRRYRRRQFRRRPYGRRRRRRRRKYKVRKKKAKITLQQWQPDCIKKCKIKGFHTLIAGAEGRQMFCYTNERLEYIQPKAPGGGGFAAEMFSLQYLYNLFIAHKNIWTVSNDYLDLCRFTGCTITLYRHLTTDFVVSYQRQPPFTIEKDTYTNIHPLNLLLRKRKKLLLSQQSNPNGKLKIKLHIKPPKTMTNKWYFQEEFAPHGLFMLEAAALNTNWSIYSQTSQSNSLTFYSLSTQFFHNSNWAVNSGSSPYKPWSTASDLTFTYPVRNGTESFTLKWRELNYLKSVNIIGGVFDKRVLSAIKVTSGATTQHNLPITIARYNPDEDTGEQSFVYLVSNHADTWQPPQDTTLKMSGKPLWMMLFGFYNYIQSMKPAKDFFKGYTFVLKSKAIKLITPHEQDTFPVIDFEFTQGQLPWDEYISSTQKALWYPDVFKQLKTLNSFVECGPYVPKYASERNDTWELKIHYCFYFKWGGPYQNNPDVSNPKNQGKYPMPTDLQATVQVANPLKQAYKKMLRAWDYRRGFITSSALKRIQQDTETDQSFSSDSEEAPQKKKQRTGELPTAQEKTEKIQDCLLSLCEENTCQDQNQSLEQLIQQQQQQQQKLKLNLFKLLIDMKKQQRKLQLQTGLLE